VCLKKREADIPPVEFSIAGGDARLWDF